MHAKRPAEAPTDPVLTLRLVLTPVGPDEVNDLLLLYSDPVVAYWTGPWTRAAVEAWAADVAARWTADGVGKWMARDRPDGSLVGRGGFTRSDLDGETVLELGRAALARTPPSPCTGSEVLATSSTQPAVRRVLGSRSVRTSLRLPATSHPATMNITI
jgi:Acetyltransferase (GNAT) domain